MGIFTFMSKVSPAFIGLCFLLHCLPMRVMAQADSIQSAMSRSLQTYGFGPELIITSPPAFYIDHNTQPDLHRAQQAGFDLPYDSLEEQLARHPHSKIFWIRAGLRNASDSILPIEIYCGTLDYTDCWWISPGHPVQLVSAGSLRSPLAGSSLIQRQYNILPLTLLPRQSGAIFLALRQRTRFYDFKGLRLYTPPALGAAFSEDYQAGYSLLVFQWLFQGFLLCQILYILFQWLIIRRKEYLYYLFYMAVIALYFLSKFESDLGLNLLFTRYPILKVYLSKTLLILPYFLYFRFVRLFLELPQHYPGLNKWITRIEYFLLIYLVADLAFILLTFDQAMQTYVFTMILLLIFVTAASFIIYLFRRRQALIYFVLTGSLFVGIGNIL